MAVPKRKTSKSATRMKRNSHYKRYETNVLKAKDGSYKRPHVDEKVTV